MELSEQNVNMRAGLMLVFYLPLLLFTSHARSSYILIYLTFYSFFAPLVFHAGRWHEEFWAQHMEEMLQNKK